MTGVDGHGLRWNPALRAGVQCTCGEWSLDTVLRNRAGEAAADSAHKRHVVAQLERRLAAARTLLREWEDGADTFGTCGHEWVSLKRMREVLYG